MILSALNGSEAQTPPPEYAPFFKDLTNQNFRVRKRAEQAFIAKAIAEVQTTLRSFPHKALLATTGDPDLDQYYKTIREAIEAKEDELSLQIPSVFTASDLLKKEDMDVSMDEALRTIAQKTGQFLSLKDTDKEFLKQRSRITKDMDGQTFWGVLHQLQTENGQAPIVSANANGSLVIQQSGKNHADMKTSSGAVSASLRCEPSGKAEFSFQVEPKLYLEGWERPEVTLVRADGKEEPIECQKKAGLSAEGVRFLLPKATVPGEIVTIKLRCTTKAKLSKTLPINNLNKELIIEQDGNRIRYWHVEKVKQGSEVVTYLSPQTDTAPPQWRFGCTPLDAKGFPLKIIGSGIYNERHTWLTEEPPATLALHLPTNQAVKAQQEFIVKGVPLP